MIIAVASLVLMVFRAGYCESNTPGFSSFGTSPVIEAAAIHQGFTLISHPTTKSIFLMDLLGRPVHTWRSNFRPTYAIPRENGNLLVQLIDPTIDLDSLPDQGRGHTGILQELNWRGKVVWEYKNPYLHHDFTLLPNGNVAAIVWEKVPKELAAQVPGGIPGTEFQGDLWSDAIVEIDNEGQIIWAWHAYEHLDPVANAIWAGNPRQEWSHANSLQYVQTKRAVFPPEEDFVDPATPIEGFIIGMPQINTIAFVDRKDQNILWQLPKGLLGYFHDATLLDNGNVLVFENAQTSGQDGVSRIGSRVVELNPRTYEVAWQFTGGQTAYALARFTATITSGAQRLPNGNTLIMNGPAGHLFEVTKEGKVVWDMLIPFAAVTNSPWPERSIFKARRYGVDEIDWPESLSPPMPPLSRLCQALTVLPGF